MIQECDECQMRGNKKPRPPEGQITATSPMEILDMDLVWWTSGANTPFDRGQHTFDPLDAESTKADTKVLNSIIRKFGMPEKIFSDNGPCFKSNDFRCFCDQLDIGHVTCSPHYHQSNGRAERASATVEQILKKSGRDVDIIKALTTSLDTPVSDNLP